MQRDGCLPGLKRKRTQLESKMIIRSIYLTIMSESYQFATD